MSSWHDLDRKLEAMWQEPSERVRVRAELERYGQAPHEAEVVRVRLAVLKLCEGASSKVAELVAAAKKDHRDVLLWAEYPSEGRALWALRPNLTKAQGEELAGVRAQDREQYRKWLKE
jgi:hypothetical protein